MLLVHVFSAHLCETLLNGSYFQYNPLTGQEEMRY